MSQPNILLFISHDTGRFISPYGIKTVHTPNAERLAREGVVFDNYFCTAPQCSPSRAALFTGRYPHATGVMGLTHAEFEWDLDRDLDHLAQHLKNLGYDTASVGMRHEMRTSENRGFDALYGETFAAKAPAVADAWLEERGQSENPFYLQVGLIETHKPYTRTGLGPDSSLGVTVLPHLVDDRDEVIEDFAGLQGMVRAWDECLGELLAILDRRGLADNTLVVVTTDHGVAVPGAKTSLYDPGIQIMFMLRWPAGGLKASERVPQLISQVDVLPTILEIAGGKAPEGGHGRSFWPLLTDQPYLERDTINAEMTFHTFYDPMRCVRTREWKYIRNFEISRSLHDAELNGLPSRLVDRRELARTGLGHGHHRHEELYDLQNDPLEQVNLAYEPEYETVRAELQRQLVSWMRETDDPLLCGPIASPFYRRTMGELGVSE